MDTGSASQLCHISNPIATNNKHSCYTLQEEITGQDTILDVSGVYFDPFKKHFRDSITIHLSCVCV
jgi:hypothetical protein